MKRIIISVCILVSALILWPVSRALAVQSPAGCNSNRLNLSISRDRISVQQGDVITYTVTAANIDGGGQIACDIDTATVVVQLPALDGTPTGTIVTLANSASFPAGSALTVIGSTTYTVNVNGGVTDIVAEARVNGTLHDAPTDHSAEIIKTIGTAVVTPTPSSGGGSGGGARTPTLPNTGVIL